MRSACAGSSGACWPERSFTTATLATAFVVFVALFTFMSRFAELALSRTQSATVLALLVTVVSIVLLTGGVAVAAPTRAVLARVQTRSCFLPSFARQAVCYRRDEAGFTHRGDRGCRARRRHARGCRDRLDDTLGIDPDDELDGMGRRRWPAGDEARVTRSRRRDEGVVPDARVHRSCCEQALRTSDGVRPRRRFSSGVAEVIARLHDDAARSGKQARRDRH